MITFLCCENDTRDSTCFSLGSSIMIVHVDEIADWRKNDDQFLKEFKLPEKKGIGKLAQDFPFPREDRISFDELRHEYKLDGIVVPRSVTKLLHEFASVFNPTYAVQAMKNGPNWESKRIIFEDAGVGTEEHEIIKYWEFKGEVARARGTLLHYHAEQMVNGRTIELPSKEFQQAKLLYEHLLSTGLKPFRAEINLYSNKLQVAGQADLLMRDSNNSIVIIDWKRSKDIKFENDRCHLQFPLEHLPETNYWLYCLQLNLYGYILEQDYDMKVVGYYLAVVHPDIEKGRLISCPRMDREMHLIAEYEHECGRCGGVRKNE